MFKETPVENQIFVFTDHYYREAPVPLDLLYSVR